MADFHSYAKEMSPESQMEAERIAQQQAVSAALLKQATTSTPNQFVGPRHRIVPLGIEDPFSKIAMGLIAGRNERKAKEDKAALIEADRQRVADAMGKYQTQKEGAPENAPTDGMGPTRPPVPADPKGAIASAMYSQEPIVRHVADTDQKAMIAKDQHAADAAARSEDRRWARESIEAVARENREARETAIPADWQKHLPSGAKLGQTAGTFYASDGDLMQMRFQGGKLVGAIDANPLPNNRGTGPEGQAQKQRFKDVSTDDGIHRFDTWTGTMEKIMNKDGSKIVKETASPTLQGNLAAAKAAGKVLGTQTETARLDMPKTIQKAEQSIKLVDEMIGSADGKIKPHPGFQSYVGATLLPGASFVEGSPQASFKKRLEQVQGRAFLEAYETLKGGGQITEIEGAKATAALQRMHKAQSEKEFIEAGREFQDVVRTGIGRAKGRAVQSPNAPANPFGFDAAKEKEYQEWKAKRTK